VEFLRENRYVLFSTCSDLDNYVLFSTCSDLDNYVLFSTCKRCISTSKYIQDKYLK